MKIEKGIPAPKQKNTSKYPFADMEVGDSVYVDGQRSSYNQAVKDGAKFSALPTAHQYGKRSGKKFTGRNEGSGVRIWRIE